MILQLLGILLILSVAGLIGRWLIDSHGKDNEQLRKLVHVLHGVGLAALAFVVPLEFIIGVEAVFFISMLVARYLTSHVPKLPWIAYMNRMYSVGRLSYGEFFFPLSAIALVFLAESKWEFAAAILILGIADALAALIGKRYGAGNDYLVFGQRKSVAGSIMFLITSLIIIWGFIALQGMPFNTVNLGLLLLTACLVTIVENLGVYGSDNLLIPLVAVVLLNRL